MCYPCRRSELLPMSPVAHSDSRLTSNDAVRLGGDRRLAHKWRNPQRRNSVFLASQDAKAETMKGESLPGLGDRARLMDHQARNGGRLGVWQAPLHRPIEVADRHPTVNIDRAVGLRAHARHHDVMIVGDVAD